MDRTDVELSESSAASANDTRAGSGEHLLSSDASTGTFHGMVVHLGQRPVAQGLMGPLVIVEPEVGAQLPPGFPGVGVSFQGPPHTTVLLKEQRERGRRRSWRTGRRFAPGETAVV